MLEKLDSNKNSSFAGLFSADKSKLGIRKTSNTGRTMPIALIAITAREIYRKVNFALKLRTFFCPLR
jgi:hypothetical protein